MFPSEMPRPQVEALTEPFWAAAREGPGDPSAASLRTFRHLPHVMCASCQSRARWVESAGRGTVFTYTIVTHSVHAATAAVVPYNVVVVKLDDCGGMLVTGNVVDCPPEDVHVGMAVEVVFERVDDEIAIPRFMRRGEAARETRSGAAVSST